MGNLYEKRQIKKDITECFYLFKNVYTYDCAFENT